MTAPRSPAQRSPATLLRRLTAVAIILLSVVGFLLCVTGAVGTWVGKRQLNALSEALFGTADDAFEFVETRLDRVRQALVTSRERVGGLSALAERLKAAGGDARAELQPVSRSLDEAFDQLKAAESGLDAVLAVARGVNRVAEASAASRAKEGDGESTSVNPRKIAELSATVADVLTRLQALRQELVEARESGQLRRESAARIIARAAELDGRLTDAAATLDQFKAEVSTARGSSAALGRRVRWWTGVAAAALVLVSLWFAASQVGMMTRGWRLARGGPLNG